MQTQIVQSIAELTVVGEGSCVEVTDNPMRLDGLRQSNLKGSPSKRGSPGPPWFSKQAAP